MPFNYNNNNYDEKVRIIIQFIFEGGVDKNKIYGVNDKTRSKIVFSDVKER